MEDQIKQKPKLEIPECSPRVQSSGPSPREMHGFPLSPQSPELVPVSSGKLKRFSDLNLEETCPELDKPSSGGGSSRISVGEYVLVRCNQSKWLLGQVRRSSKTGVRVWVGAAQTLVEVPFGLLVSHLVKLDSPGSSSSLSGGPSSSSRMVDSLEVGACGQVLAPFHCVRPAHLSHRKLYQPLGLLTTQISKQSSSTKVSHPATNEQTKELFVSSSTLPAPPSSQAAGAARNAQKSGESSTQCKLKFSEEQEASSVFTSRPERASPISSSVNDAGLTVIENGLKKSIG